MVLYKGIEWRRRITVTDDDTGLPTDLTGKSVVFELRRRSSESPLVTLSVGSGITLLDQDTSPGQTDLVLSAVSSATLVAASHVIRILVDDQVVYPPTKLTVHD